jgi:hypothetical protein
MFNIFGKLLCKCGRHNYETTGVYTDETISITIAEGTCSRCGVKAYALDFFAPQFCTCLKKQTIEDALHTMITLEEQAIGTDKQPEETKKSTKKSGKKVKKDKATV